jgi:hypothetical protein
MRVDRDIVNAKMFFEESNGIDRGALIDQHNVLTVKVSLGAREVDYA